MAETILVEFSFFIIFALLGTVVSIKARQPYVVGLLLLGMIAGPHALSMVKSEELIGTFSELGAILLLFTVGIEFSVSRLMKHGFRAVLITFFKMIVLFFFGYELALYFGIGLTPALFVGAMVAVTSTAIMYKMAGEKGTLRDPVMPLLLSMLIVEDFAAVAALTFFSSLGSGAPSGEDKVYSLLVSVALLGVFYMFVRRHAADALVRMTSQFNEESLIFVSFSLCLVMAFIADFFGLSPAIGAFLAGSIIASLPNSRKIEKGIRPLLLTFSAFFFLALGMQVDPAAILDNLAFASALSAVFVAVCFASVFVLLYSTGTGGRRALLGASSMAVLGEFSLIIASTATGSDRHLLLSVGSFGVVATAMASAFLIDRRHCLEAWARRNMPSRSIATGRAFAAYFSALVRDFAPGGNFWRVSTVCWHRMASKLANLVAILVCIWLARTSVSLLGLASEMQAAQLRGAIALAGGALVLYYLVQIMRDLKPVLDALARAIARHRRNAKDESIILRDIGFATLFLAVALALPEMEAALLLPSIFMVADELAFLLALAFVWDLVLHAREMMRRRRAR